MLFLHRLAEEKIKQALADGQFDNLPGHGKPIAFDEFADVPEHLRVAFRILKSAGVLPQEMELRKEIASLQKLLADCKDEPEQRRLRCELNDKNIKYDMLMEQNRRKLARKSL